MQADKPEAERVDFFSVIVGLISPRAGTSARPNGQGEGQRKRQEGAHAKAQRSRAARGFSVLDSLDEKKVSNHEPAATRRPLYFTIAAGSDYVLRLLLENIAIIQSGAPLCGHAGQKGEQGFPCHHDGHAELHLGCLPRTQARHCPRPLLASQNA